MIENKFARFMRNSGPARFLIPLGIVLIVFGFLTRGFNTENFVETVGRVTAVEEHVEVIDGRQETQYDVTVSFTADGKTYETVFPNLGKAPKVGGDIKVLYDPADPNRNSNSKVSKFFAPAMMGGGALVIVLGAFLTAKAVKKSKALDQTAPAASRADFAGFKTAPGVTEYYVRFDGHSLKPGYIMEDADRNILYEGTMLKQNLVGARPYEFTNHVNGSVQPHEVGHVMTQTYNSEFFSAKSWFKFDGKNIWDVLHESGLRLETDLVSKFPNLVYNLSKDGRPVARFETSGMYVHEDEAEQHRVNLPVGRYYYRVWTNSDDFDSLFLTVFAVSETEQIVVE